jgi:pSer/pThr/pTyr-binding forkhead associated (FHA) protein
MEVERPMLITEEGFSESQRWLVEKELTLLGRWSDNDVVLPDRLVSRHHAHIRRVGSQFFLEDLNSTNGTFVNGERVATPHILQDGDSIQIAPRFQMRFVDSASTAPMPTHKRVRRLEVNEAEKRVTIGETEVDLSAAQYSLLLLLFKQAGKVASRRDIVQAVWSDEDATGVTNQAMDALIRRLRESLAGVDPDHNYIQTVRGHGFKFENR